MATYGVDPAWGNVFGNIASLFDPKVAAEGAALQARTRNFDAETRYNTARAAGLEDQNNALSEKVLLAAGYTPEEIAAIRATRSNSVADVFRGTNFNRGRGLLNDPSTVRKGALLLGEGAAATNANSAFDQATADKIRAEKEAAAQARAAIAAGATVDAAKVRAASAADVARINAAGGKGKVDPNTLPFVTHDPAGDISRLFGVTNKDGTWVPPSEEEVVQPIMQTAQSLIANGLATRDNAVANAIAAMGYLPKKDVVKESNWGVESDVTKPRPAKAKVLDASITEDGMDAGEIINIPLENLGSVKDPNGPVMKASEGTIVQIGNIAYKRVPGGLQRVR